VKRSLAVLLALAALSGSSARTEPARVGAVQVEATPVPFNPADPSVHGRRGFAFVSGLQLKGVNTTRLGGLSDLRVSPDGALISVSDEGALLRGRLILDADGRPTGIADASLTPLTGLDGQPLQGKTECDSEGLAVWPNGDVMISFERDHRIWIYPADGGPPRAAPKPDVAMPDNEGMEGLAIAPSQGPDAYWVGVEGGSIWLCHLQGACVQDQTQVRPPIGYRLTALSETPQGDLAILHHGWDPIRGSHVILWLTRPRPGKPPKVLAKLPLAKPLTIDNFEGVETQALPDGGLRFFLISDDNFSASQRTLLLTFDWKSKAGRRH
jgi:hypothetical protein